MSVKVENVIVVVCDGCGADAEDLDTGVRWVWPGVPEAKKSLTDLGELSWEFTDDGQHFCPECRQARCEHEWTTTEFPGGWEECTRCSADRRVGESP